MHEVGDQPDVKAAALKVLVSASISLFCMLVDLGFVVADEFKHVLSQLRSSWRVRLYASVRMMGFLGQIFNVYFSFRMYSGIYSTPAGCYIWFSYQALIIQVLLFYVEYLLAKRVFALFIGSQPILIVLVSFLLAQVSSMVVSAQFSIRANQYTSSCWVTKSSPGNAFFSATTMMTHIIIFFATFWRFFCLPKEFTRHPLGKTVFQESAFSMASISVIMLFLTLTSLEVIKPAMSGNVVFSWLVSVLWVSMGHLYISQEKIKHDEALSKIWERSTPLTSQIEMGDMSISISETMCSSSEVPTVSTLHASLSTPASKASRLPPSSVRTSEWSGETSVPVDTASSSGCVGEGAARAGDPRDCDSGPGPLTGAEVRERYSGDDPSSQALGTSAVETPGDEPSQASTCASGVDTLPTDDPPADANSSSHPPS